VSTASPGTRPRLVGVIALGLAALLLLFVIASLSLDEGDTTPIEIEGQGEVQEQLGGIPQDGARLGVADAPVTVEVFSDLQCEPCADYQRSTISPLIDGPVRRGDLKLEFHHFPISQPQAGFGLASYGAVAAANQDDQWQFIQLFFRNQEEAERRGVTDEFLDRVAGAIPVNFNVEQWQRDLDDRDVRETLEAEDELAAERQFPAEPAVVVSGPRGTRELIQSPSLRQITDAIDQVG
jgi:protein-disulfide isomerase